MKNESLKSTNSDSGSTAGEAAHSEQSGGQQLEPQVRQDLDRLIVLVKESSSVKGITTFLGRRGLDLFVSNSLQDVIERLSSGWSKFLLLSLNYPHPKVDFFPTLLGQSFQAETIVFAESLDRKISPRLTACRAKHVLHGTASGPVVLMRLRQLQKELAEGIDPQSASGSALERSQGAGGEDGSDVRISGSGAGQKGAILLKGGKTADPSSDGLDPMTRLMKALGESGSAGSQNSGHTGAVTASTASGSSPTPTQDPKKPSVHFESTGNNRLMKLMPPPSSQAKDKIREQMHKGRLQAKEQGQAAPSRSQSNSPNHQEGSGQSHSPGQNESSGKAQTSGQANDSVPKEKSGQSQRQAAGESTAPAPSSVGEGLSNNSQPPLSASNDKTAGFHNADQNGPHKGSVAHHERDQSAEGGSSRAATQHKGLQPLDQAAVSKMTPVQRLQLCAARTLEKLFAKPTEGRDAMLQYRTASVLILRSDIVSGSIAAAVGKGDFDDRSILQKVETELLEQLTEIGIEVAIGALEAFEVHPASSIEEAFLNSEFTVIARSATFEVGFGYIDTLPQEPTIVNTIDEMIEVDIQSIQADVPLPFDVYIHLPANQKYLRYVKTDAALSQKQKQKLSQGEVDKLFLGKESKDAYRKHATVTNFKKKISKAS